MSLDINLLHQHKTSKFTQRAVLAIRISAIVVGMIVLVVLASLFVLKKNVESSIAEKTLHQGQIMAKIAKNQDKETSALLLNEKYKQIDLVLKAEPPFLKYYQTLIASLPNSSESGKLVALTIQKAGTATAQMTFPNILALTKFLTRLESEEFKKNFSSLNTSGIAFTGDNAKELFFSLDVKF